MMKKITALGMVIGMFAGVTGVTVAEETQASKHGSLDQLPGDTARSDGDPLSDSQSSFGSLPSYTTPPTSESTLTASESEFSDGQTSPSPTSSTDSLSDTEPTSTSSTSGISSDGEDRGQEGDIVEARNDAMEELKKHGILMTLEDNGAELRFKQAGSGSTTDYSGMDFSKVTKLVFEGITVNQDTVLKIRESLDKLKSGLSETVWRTVQNLEFKNCLTGKPDYISVIDNLAGNAQSFTTDGNIDRIDLKLIADVLHSYERELTINITRTLSEKLRKELASAYEYLRGYYNLKMTY